MCELLALSTSQASRLTFSLHTPASHGDTGGRAADGWGVAFYQGADVALFREPTAAKESALARFLESHGPRTRLAISHIRHATRGTVQLANAQPFTRELGGRTHAFARNGDLPIGRRRTAGGARWRSAGNAAAGGAVTTRRVGGAKDPWLDPCHDGSLASDDDGVFG